MMRKGEARARPAPADPVLSPERAGPAGWGLGRKARALERLAVVLAVGGIAVVQAREVIADAEGPGQRRAEGAARPPRRRRRAARGTPRARPAASTSAVVTQRSASIASS
jgi:hypothetical protein